MADSTTRPAQARRLGDGDWGVWVAFSEKDAAKALPTARWDPSLKCWRVRDQFAADAQRLVDTINGGADAQVVAAFRVIFAKVPTELRDRVHRALVKALHPDAGGDEAAMKALTRAWGEGQ